MSSLWLCAVSLPVALQIVCFGETHFGFLSIIIDKEQFSPFNSTSATKKMNPPHLFQLRHGQCRPLDVAEFIHDAFD